MQNGVNHHNGSLFLIYDEERRNWIEQHSVFGKVLPKVTQPRVRCEGLKPRPQLRLCAKGNLSSGLAH